MTTALGARQRCIRPDRRRRGAIHFQQQIRNNLVIGGLREVVALGKAAVQRLELVHLLFGFGAFRNRHQAQGLGQHDDDLDNLVALGVDVHLRDERSIDLQRIHREPCSRLSDEYPVPKSSTLRRTPSDFEFGKDGSCLLRIAHGDGFGNFQLQIAGIEPGLFQGLRNPLREIRMRKFL